jgi:3-oxoacyl-[acyl-carrier protein] reductase
VALVTGAASGFGKGSAELFVAEGAKVAIVDLNEQGTRDVAASLGDAAIAIGCDVADGAQVAAAVKQTSEAFGALDIVVNNAGWTNEDSALMETDEATFRKI